MTTKRVRSLLALGLAALLSSCTGEPDRTGTSTKLEVLWSMSQQTLGYSSLQDDLILAGSDVRAIDLSRRQLAFNLRTRADIGRTSFAAVGDNLVLVEESTRSTNRLHLVDRAGRTLNTIELPGFAYPQLGQQGPYVVGNALYVGAGPVVYKYDTRTLDTPGVQPVWSKRSGENYLGAVYATDEDHVYVGTNHDNHLVSLRGDGSVRWTVQFTTPDHIKGAVESMGRDGDALIVSVLGELRSYDLETGRLNWRNDGEHDCPYGGRASARHMEFGDGKVFLGLSGGSCMAAFDTATGKLAWLFSGPNGVTFNSKPVYVRGVVYATNSMLWAVDAKTGKALAVSPPYLGGSFGTPVHYDAPRNQVLVWGNTGLTAFRPVR